MSEYVGWKLFNKVAIIAREEAVDKERYQNMWYYGRYTIPQAYICDASDKKMIASGSCWAKWTEYFYEEDGRTRKETLEHQPVIVILDNKDFTLEVLDSANGSSQDGMWCFGIGLSHFVKETYLYINLYRWCISIGYLYDFEEDWIDEF